MKGATILGGKKFVSASTAAAHAGITRDYVGKLCRSRELFGLQLDGLWVVEEKSLEHFLEQKKLKATARRQQLQRERRGEYLESKLRTQDLKGDAYIPKKSDSDFHKTAAVSSQESLIKRSVSILENEGQVLAPVPGKSLVTNAQSVFSSPLFASHVAHAIDLFGKGSRTPLTLPALTHGSPGVVHAASTVLHQALALIGAFIIVFGSFAIANGEFREFAVGSMSDTYFAALKVPGKVAVLKDRLATGYFEDAKLLSVGASAVSVEGGFMDASARSVYAKISQLFASIVHFGQPAQDDSVRGLVTVQVSPVRVSADLPAHVAVENKPTTQPRNSLVSYVVERVVERTPVTVVNTFPSSVTAGISESFVLQKLAELDTKFASQISNLSRGYSPSSNAPSLAPIYQTIAQTNRIDQLNGVAITGGTITNANITGGTVVATGFSGVLPIANGGIATSTAPSYGNVLVGNSSGGYDLVATSSLGISGGSGLPSGSDGQLQYNNSGSFGGASNVYFDDANNRLGVGTSSPYATLAIVGQAVAAYFTATSSIASSFDGGLLSLASTTIGGGAQATGLTVSGGATTTGNLVVQGTGTSTFAGGISTTRLDATSASSTFNGLRITGNGLQISTIANCSETLETDASGNIICGTDATATGAADSFTFTTNYGVTNAATSSPLWAQAGINASSTSHFATFDAIAGTTTNFAISNVASSLLKTNATGGIIPAVAGTDYLTSSNIFSYLFPANATTTLLSFNGGLTAYASSTIGNGTASGGLTVFGTATTTNLTVSNLASTSQLVASNSFTIGTLSGFLKATAGSVATALVNLTTDVTGILPTANGGTGWGNIQANSLVIGNGTGALATTTAGTNGQVLALVAGVPTWTATTTFSTGLTYLNGNVTADLGTSISAAEVANGDHGDFTYTGGSAAIDADAIALSTDTTGNYVATLADSGTGTLTIANSGSENAAVTAALNLTNANTWTGIQRFFGSASSTLFSANQAYFGATATSSFSTAGVLNLAGLTSTLLKTDANGSVVAATAGTDYSNFAYLFPSNATTTGLGLYASTTIGAGAQTTGLTISGGATTTGNAYFAGNVGVGTANPQTVLDILGTASSTKFYANSGSVAAPAYSFAGRPTQGIWDNGGQIEFSLAGTDLFSFQSDGTLWDKSNTAGAGLYIGASADVSLTRTSTGLLSITGLVGIGTTSPYAKLSVV
ncbi:MAG: helix-turn-helix domain-containing protein, partial [Patescibacteria group bacterium]